MYQVLYRKWRPKVFSDVVGQPHIKATLKNEIESGRHSHAYLFTGSRGTGKTSCAKILSKAVNCLHPVNGDPCNECEICKKIDNGTIMDVIEIDAASNNSVENIRDIRQEVNFAPASCKYRVYIIDEVHMLSAGAFNALLKTLEEPPPHVKFILATTEVHKIPATILSRCQRFDFRRIPSEDMMSRMEYIGEQEGFVLEKEAGMLISRISDGGMRDALSLLDQCANRSHTITPQLVSQVAGLTSKDYLFKLADAVCDKDCKSAMGILDELHNSSCDMERLCSELINHYRSLMIVKTVKNANDLIVCTKEEFEQTVEQAEKYTLESILFSIDLFQETLGDMKKGVNKRIEMEVAVIKLATPSLSGETQALVKRISDLEKAIQSGVTVTRQEKVEKPEKVNSDPPKKTETETLVAVSEPKEKKKKEQISETVQEQPAYREETAAPKRETPPAYERENKGEPEPQETGDLPFARWPEVIKEIRKTNMPLWGVLDNSSAYIHGEFILVDCQYPTFGEMIRQGSNASDVKKAIYAVTGQKYRLGIFKNKEDKTKVKKDPLDDLLNKMRQSEIKVEINE